MVIKNCKTFELYMIIDNIELKVQKMFDIIIDITVNNNGDWIVNFPDYYIDNKTKQEVVNYINYMKNILFKN